MIRKRTTPMERLLGASLTLLVWLLPAQAMAQELPAPPQIDSTLNTALVFAALAIIPLVLIVVTSFAKIAIVLGFLRNALGLQQILPTAIITALAVVLSAYIMAPVGLSMLDAAQDIPPNAEGFEQLRQRSDTIAAPLQTWLKTHAGQTERDALAVLAKQLHGTEHPTWTQPEHPLVLVPSFALTELKEAFIIGVLLLIPFLVLEIVVANVLLSVGLHGLSPTVVSLPFKILLFVLIDGWTLLVQGLVMGYVQIG